MMDGSKGFSDALTGEQKIRNFNINFGPQHPAAHGVLRLVLELAARSLNAAIRISGCCTVAPKS
jgi:NADH:ubiquinone oxidoreductase subunit D